MHRIPDSELHVPLELFYAARSLGVTGVRTFASRRVHAGSDASAWSKPTLVIYGEVADETAVRSLAKNWTGALEFAGR